VALRHGGLLDRDVVHGHQIPERAVRELRKGLAGVRAPRPAHARHRHYRESELAELDRDGHRPRVHIDFKMLFDERQRRPYIGIEVQDPRDVRQP